MSNLYQKLASDAYKTFRLMSENSFDSILITDMDNKIVYTNPAFEKLTGFT